MPGVIVHEWIERSGGAERVVDALANEFPTADIWALWNDAPDRYPNHSVRESWIAKTPLRRNKAAALPFLIPTWRRAVADRAYDWAIVSSHLFAHHVRFANIPDVPKYVYAHTPARYIWEPGLDGRGDTAVGRVISPVLRSIDRKRAAEATSIAANSLFVARRVERAWDRAAGVIYPPVQSLSISGVRDWRDRLSGEELREWALLPETFLLGASRFVNYKGLDKVILTAAHMDIPVVIAGHGPERQKLESEAERAGANVHFVTNPSDVFLYCLYQNSLAYVFPAIEDFGIMPVEAMATGARVVVLGSGGASESVAHLSSGIHAASTVPEDLAQAVRDAQSISRESAVTRSLEFDSGVFAARVQEWVS